ncbi:magnesium transporter [Lagierella sp.]|uniref:magnesium transporter n=1 Tax=Lagierella sp. TaxID=2849657 RepID=UPI002613A57C|nr:magnesium transporter [Lagierella sp.]
MEKSLEILEERLHESLEENNLQEAKLILNSLNIYDIAEFFNNLSQTNLTICFNLLSKDTAALVFAEMDIEQQKLLIAGFSDEILEQIINGLRTDDKVDIIEELPSNLVKKVLKFTNPDHRRIINTMLNYPKDSAGSIMTIEYAATKAGHTVGEVIQLLKKTGANKETIDIIYIIDDTRHLIGEVALSDLVLSDSEAQISSIMNHDVISVNTIEDREEVARIFTKYDFYTMPVVDNENRLVGIITVDDVLDILEKETTEDMDIMSAITPTEKTYKQLSVLEIWKNRIPWLLILLISSTFTSLILMNYEKTLEKYVVLAAFLPMITDTGGNAGSQSASTIIRSLSLKEIDLSDLIYVLWKEFRVAILAGITLAFFNFIKLMFFDKVGMSVAFVVSLTVTVTVMLAKATGSVLPVVAESLGADPAVMASPLITTIVDALAILVYLKIAMTILPF